MKFKDSNLIFNNNNIWCEDFKFHVMSDWEHPLMKANIDIICEKDSGDILEIGFGMGISSDYIQEYNINTHTIVECHPQILERLYKWSEGKKNVIIIEGEWGKVTDKLNLYDGIFYDAEHDEDIKRVSELVNYLKVGGKFTYFNPYGKNLTNNFKSLNVEYEILENITPPKNDYFNSNIYYVPIVKKI